MRITGLASGMDTETMIKDMMRAQRMPMEKVLQRKQYMEWQRDDYRTVNRQLFDFRNLVSDNMMRSSTFSQKTVNSSAPDELEVRNINSTSDFSGIIKVEQLAKNATMQSSSSVLSSEADLTRKLSEVKPTLTVPTSFTVKSIKTDGSLDTLGYQVNITTDTTMQNILDDLNNNSGVNAVFDSFTGKLAITAKNSGSSKNSDHEIEFSGDFAQYFMKLDATNSVAAVLARGSEGLNSKFTFNGLTTERSTNTFQISGFDVSLKKASNIEINFSSSTNTDKVLESVTKFVDEYNKILADLNGQIRERNNRDFQPLTKEQRSELDEKEIELWEEKAKSGTLRNDSIFSNSLSQMRTILNSSVETSNGTIRLSEIGINTSTNYADRGKLVIDADKLKKAISDNPNGIYELFSADGATTSQKGLGRQIRESLDATRDKIVKKAGSDSAVNNTFSLGRTINGFDSQITRFEARLQLVESRYYRQFGAMEAAIQRANQQSAYLMNSFGGGQ